MIEYLSVDPRMRSTLLLALFISVAQGNHLNLRTNVKCSSQSMNTGQEEPACFQPGECAQSLYIGGWYVEDSQACLTQCQSVDECIYFTYYEDEGGLCTGFANCEVFQEGTCFNCYSGDRNCEGTVQYQNLA